MAGSEVFLIMKAYKFLVAFALSWFAISGVSVPMAMATGPDSIDFSAVDAYVEAQMKAARIPGVALAVVQGDQITHLQGFGKADPGGRAVTPQTPFMIASLTKSFTALAIMQLSEAGKVDLNAPVQRYLPWFRVADAEASARITVRHLLNHTSGLSTRTGRMHQTDGRTDDGALERAVRALRSQHLAHPVGAVYQYSGANYITLGMIVQAVSGLPYEQYIQQQVFEPLGMGNSFTSRTEAEQHGMARGYRLWFGVPVATHRMPDVRAGLPEGGLAASAEDMAHYLIANLNEGRFGNRSILSPEGMAALHRPAVTMPNTGYDAQAGDYAMGWKVMTMNGIPVVRHDGEVPDFHADIVLVPERKLGIVLLMNADTWLTGQHLRGIIDGVTSLVVGRKPPVIEEGWGPRLIVAAFAVVPVLQVAGALLSLRKLRRWRNRPELRPHGTRGWLRRVGVPLVVNLALSAYFLIVTPMFFGATLRNGLLTQPDLGYPILFAGLFAFGWGVIRAILATALLRQSTDKLAA